MVKGRMPFVAGVIFAAVSMAIGLWENNGTTIGISLTALILLIPSAKYCPDRVAVYCVIAGIAVIVCAVLTATVASEDALVNSDIPSERWTYVLVSAVIYGAAMVPMILVFFFTVAAAFGSSYNWVTASSLGWLAGLGMTAPQYLMTLVFQNSEVQDEIILNTHIVTGMLVALVIFIVFSLFLSRILRKNRWLITANGLEAMQ